MHKRQNLLSHTLPNGFTDHLTVQIIKQKSGVEFVLFCFFLFDDTSSVFLYDILKSSFGLFTYISRAISNGGLCPGKKNRPSKRVTKFVNPDEMVNIMVAYCP